MEYKVLHSYNKDGLPRKVIVEPKYDGIWLSIIRQGGEIQCFSRRGQRKVSIEQGLSGIKIPSGVMLYGEAEYGSQWGRKMLEKRGYPVIWIFDVVAKGDIRTRKNMVKEICRGAGKGDYVLVPGDYQIIDSADTDNWYDRYVKEGYEGIVVKYPLDSDIDNEIWSKRKKELTMDYVCVGFEYSTSPWKVANWKGKLVKAILGGLYVDGKLEPICRVGSMNLDLRKELSLHPSRYIGRVFEAKGFELFYSGALRHPSFVRWRDDKSPEQCRKEEK